MAVKIYHVYKILVNLKSIDVIRNLQSFEISIVITNVIYDSLYLPISRTMRQQQGKEYRQVLKISCIYK